MKKTIFAIGLILIIYLSGNIGEAKVIIPKEAIRLRVIPNSNSKYDLDVKKDIKETLQDSVIPLLKDTKTIEEARIIINNNLTKIDKNVKKTLENTRYKDNYIINFGYNYFPQKEFRNVVYKEGYYESLVVTLGKGSGDNWWCVLFPPLCLMEAEESTDITYTSYIKEILKKYKKGIK